MALESSGSAKDFPVSDFPQSTFVFWLPVAARQSLQRLGAARLSDRFPMTAQRWMGCATDWRLTRC